MGQRWQCTSLNKERNADKLKLKNSRTGENPQVGKDITPLPHPSSNEAGENSFIDARKRKSESLEDSLSSAVTQNIRNENKINMNNSTLYNVAPKPPNSSCRNSPVSPTGVRLTGSRRFRSGMAARPCARCDTV